jgi:hypothetical protein
MDPEVDVLLLERLREITGHRPCDFRRTASQVLASSSEDAATYVVLTKSMGVNRSLTTEFRILRRDGAVRWVGHLCRPIRSMRASLAWCRSNRDIDLTTPRSP